jgi:hypothetical protein
MFAPTALEAAGSSVTMALDAITFTGLAWAVGALLVDRGDVRLGIPEAEEGQCAG